MNVVIFNKESPTYVHSTGGNVGYWNKPGKLDHCNEFGVTCEKMKQHILENRQHLIENKNPDRNLQC